MAKTTYSSKEFKFKLFTGSDREHLELTEEFSLTGGESTETVLPGGVYYKVVEEETDYRVSYTNQEGILNDDTEVIVVNMRTIPAATGVAHHSYPALSLGLGAAMYLLLRKIKKRGKERQL